MNGLLLSPLGPALLLLFASILLRIVASPRRSSVLALLTLLPLALTLALLLILRNVPGAQVLRASWSAVVIPSLNVQWALDGWNWICLALLLLTTATAVLLTWRSPGKRAGAAHGLTFLFAAAAALTLVSDNLLALSGAWIAADIALMAVARGRGPQSANVAPIWLEVTSSLLVMIAIGITDARAASASLAAAPLPPETIGLLLTAGAIRMAAYPWHLWIAPHSVARERGQQLLVSCGGVITGAWLLGRLIPLGAAVWMDDPVWLPVLTLLTLAAGLAAWLARSADRFALLTAARAVWLWLVVAAAPAAISRDALGWALVGTVLSLMLLAVGRAIHEQWNWKLPLTLAAVAMAGVPLTAGMPAYALAKPATAAVYLLWVVAAGLALACVFLPEQPPEASGARAGVPDPAASRLNWPVIRLLSALGICLIPLALWGLQPTSLAQSAGFGIAASLLDLLGRLGVFGLLGVLAALALGWGIARVSDYSSETAVVWRARVGEAAGLGWLLQAGRWLFGWIETGGGTVLRIVEGEGYLGWVILALVAAWLIFLV